MASRTSTNANLFYPMLSQDSEIPDSAVIEAMIAYGGSFVRALGQAALCADPENREIIKRSWPHYWRKHLTLAAHRMATAAPTH
jgi:hypothetical protein